MVTASNDRLQVTSLADAVSRTTADDLHKRVRTGAAAELIEVHMVLCHCMPLTASHNCG